MPGENLIPGFYGKIPAAGDFVGRSLPSAYVRFWDRWIARNLAPRLAAGPWEERPALRFMLGLDMHGPMTGVVMASTDKAGRSFPLTLAAAPPSAAAEIAVLAASWFVDIEEVGEQARYGEFDADALRDRLAMLPFPAVDGGGEPVRGMVFWIDPFELYDVDPEEPGETLRYLLAGPREVA
ncbi:type VI secretion-associated protein [Mesorhizobium sp. L-8-10]|uniref:type VI secretion system-associated protein TagF n=1 Tax=Mesorhizobium sp. L-8-10 TaxID=2744523 RepID=UPI001925B756|nr:type VI secretion system-associated protein TagF [Mesorhizobium sp. L-8-10]BCH33435.1 type VI secretion-associated protein [Mesorhizobium sp. L-8-10]